MSQQHKEKSTEALAEEFRSRHKQSASKEPAKRRSKRLSTIKSVKSTDSKT